MPTKVRAAAKAVPAPVAEEPIEEPVYEAGESEAPMDPEPSEDEESEDESPEEQEPSEDEESEDEEEGPVQLTGARLLEFYDAKRAQGCNHARIAFLAGYYSKTKTGSERVLKAQFNQRLLEAQGVDTGGGTGSGKGTGGGNAGLTRARVSGTGILLVSQLAARRVGAEPGYVFSVEYPQGDLEGPGAQILLTLTDEFKEVVPRGPRGATAEQPGTPLPGQNG